MSKSCAKCQKTVYPMEELKCLDRTWHKGCFKCNECGMTLNMKTYKGFDKLPYCEAHVPKAKATTVADTPEFKRIQENTKIQSNAVYHAEFEKTKGKFTQVTDDPELMRIKQNTKIISNVAYHGDLEKKALMEQKRNLSGDGDGVGPQKNKNGVPARSPSSYMDEISSVPTSSHPSAGMSHHSSHHNPQQQPPSYNPPQQQQQQQQQSASYNRGSNNYGHHDEPQQQQQFARQYAPQQVHHQPQPAAASHNNMGHHQQQRDRERERDLYNQQGHHNYMQQQQQQHLNHGTGGGNPSPYSSRGQANVIYTSDGGPVNANASRKVGSIADYDPMNNYYGSAEQQRAAQAQQQARMAQQQGYGGYQQPQSHGQMPMQQQKHHPPPPQQQQQQQAHGPRYRALYDYEAQDVDELSFAEGDLIVDCTPIDEGWLTGTNLRSKQRGMLPANYVQNA